MRGASSVLSCVLCGAVLAACANADLVSPDAPEADAGDVDAADAAIDAVDACVPGPELCNATDDDCDGRTDEGLDLGTMCDGPDADQCAEGMVVCNGAGATTCSDDSGDAVEICNALDDDCDGMMDEGFAVGTMCDGADTDSCREGMIVCAADGTATCSDVTGSTPEICNGLDDDCVGGVDDGFAVGMPCSTGIGGCARAGQYMCNGAGTGVVCSATAGAAVAEICGDGIDQDCNGADVTCPVNDRPTGAVNISAGGTFTVDLAAARDDDASSATGCGSTGGRDVFYQLTLPAAEVVYLDTFGSSYDTVIRVYAGTCSARAGTPICDDDAGVCAGAQSQLATQLAAGTWCVVVDQYSSTQTTGATTLTVVRGGRTGTAIAAGSGTRTGTTCGAANTWTPGCQSSSTAGDQAYFFTVCPSETRTVAASTCTTATSWDSVVYLRKTGTASDLGCNDDGPSGCGTVAPIRLSSFTGASAAGPGLFWLVVDGFLSTCGAYTLTYTM
ncbi:MAG TPA: MopE-related protein [Kofleriaceae bacterium]|nr:MopE-related protein [Kofleriaceae bacterium]